MMQSKPVLTVDTANNAAGALPALNILAKLDGGRLHHEKHDLRHPLGIYNISVARLSDKVATCASRLEDICRRANTLKEANALQAETEAVVDYIELSLYAAAEHVDDVSSIALCNFRSLSLLKNAPAYRELMKAVKKIRDRISAVTNALKHNQARIRLFLLEFRHDDQPMCLHGLFVEQYSAGCLGPSPILHKGIEKIISLPSFLWEFAIYLFEMSRALAVFLKQLHIDVEADDRQESAPLCKICVALARIPNYSMDGAHPFGRVTLRLEAASDEAERKLDSGIYGSVKYPWRKSEDHKFGGSALRYAGDGVSKNFALAAPSKIALQHWE
jgi:hypothetical protein